MNDELQKLAYSYQEAAEAVGVSAATLRRHVNNGDLAVRYIGSKPVIQADELRAWLDALPSEAPSERRRR